MKTVFVLLLLVISFATCRGQTLRNYADKVRKEYDIPELGYAVVTSDSILELEVLGEKKVHTNRKAKKDDRFRIGSNTKTITGFIAAQLVQQGKIAWDTKFFDLFPELKKKSKPAYRELTLLDLLSFRTQLISYTYTYPLPTRDQFSGDEQTQRRQFVAWCLRQPPAVDQRAIHFSNVGYVAASLMLEKASGKTYKQLVGELGRQLNISFAFGQPNSKDSTQPWGHNEALTPEPPGDSYKLSWLEAAGNVNISLPEFAVFIQEQLKGLQGRSQLLPKSTFSFLHYGRPDYAVGWFWEQDIRGRKNSFHTGNPGSFLSKVYVFPDQNRAFLLFANAQTEEADAGLDLLYSDLKRVFLK